MNHFEPASFLRLSASFQNYDIILGKKKKVELGCFALLFSKRKIARKRSACFSSKRGNLTLFFNVSSFPLFSPVKSSYAAETP